MKRPPVSTGDVQHARRGRYGSTAVNVGRHILRGNALVDSPKLAGAFLRLHWKRLIWALAGVVGLVAELAIVWVAYELVDLCLSLMEVWADLARKHLELTL